MTQAMNIRDVQLEDALQICRIYNYYIENTCVSFETVPVTVEEMEIRIRSFLEEGDPYYVGVVDRQIIGFANLHKWNNRFAYSSTKEVTIYLDPAAKGKGYGTQLYEYLFEMMDRSRIHTLIAGICIPNDASVKLHENFGFRQVSHYREIGYKFNQWLDVGHWQLLLKDDSIR